MSDTTSRNNSPLPEIEHIKEELKNLEDRIAQTEKKNAELDEHEKNDYKLSKTALGFSIFFSLLALLVSVLTSSESGREARDQGASEMIVGLNQMWEENFSGENRARFNKFTQKVDELEAAEKKKQKIPNKKTKTKNETRVEKFMNYFIEPQYLKPSYIRKVFKSAPPQEIKELIQDEPIGTNNKSGGQQQFDPVTTASIIGKYRTSIIKVLNAMESVCVVYNNSQSPETHRIIENAYGDFIIYRGTKMWRFIDRYNAFYTAKMQAELPALLPKLRNKSLVYKREYGAWNSIKVFPQKFADNQKPNHTTVLLILCFLFVACILAWKTKILQVFVAGNLKVKRLSDCQ